MRLGKQRKIDNIDPSAAVLCDLNNTVIVFTDGTLRSSYTADLG